MARATTFETMKAFIHGLPASLLKNGRLAFYVEAKGDKNRFFVQFVDEDNDKYSVNMTTYSYERGIIIGDLNKLFKLKYPRTMLRGDQYVSYDELVSTYGLDKQEVVSAIFKKLRSSFKNNLKEYYGRDTPLAYFVIHPNYKPIQNKDDNMTPAFASFEELVIWVELNRL